MAGTETDHVTDVVQVRGRHPWLVRCSCGWRAQKASRLQDAQATEKYHRETGDVRNGTVK